MRALDTNVLVRLLARDDEAQYQVVLTFMTGADERGESLFVSDAVLCEVLWVLARSYRLRRTALAEIVATLLSARHLTFAERQGVADALDAFRRGPGDFADYLIRERALAAGCSAVVTFDQALHGEPGFVAPA